MGTRHLVCVYYCGKFYIAQYGQWDGYPTGQGIKIIKFIRDPANIARLKAGLEHIKQIKSEEDVPDAENDIDGMPHPALSRDTGAGILEMVATARADRQIPIVDSLDFINSGIFCEWAYVVDLDEEIVEIFGNPGLGGISKEHARSTRFNDVGKAEDTVLDMVESFSFARLQAAGISVELWEDKMEELEERVRRSAEDDGEDEDEDEGNA